jgi:hypothetical protein
MVIDRAEYIKNIPLGIGNPAMPPREKKEKERIA